MAALNRTDLARLGRVLHDPARVPALYRCGDGSRVCVDGAHFDYAALMGTLRELVPAPAEPPTRGSAWEPGVVWVAWSLPDASEGDYDLEALVEEVSNPAVPAVLATRAAALAWCAADAARALAELEGDGGGGWVLDGGGSGPRPLAPDRGDAPVPAWADDGPVADGPVLRWCCGELASTYFVAPRRVGPC